MVDPARHIECTFEEAGKAEDERFVIPPDTIAELLRTRLNDLPREVMALKDTMNYPHQPYGMAGVSCLVAVKHPPLHTSDSSCPDNCASIHRHNTKAAFSSRPQVVPHRWH